MAARYQRLSDALLISDSEIVKRLRNGDESVYNKLVDTSWKPLWRYSATILRNSDAAKDVVIDVFAWLWNNRKRLEISNTLDAFLFSAVRNRSISVIRSDNRYQAHLDQIGDDADHENHVTTDVDSAHDIDALLSTLPLNYREAIELRWIQGLSIAEVASTLEISEAAAYKTLQRGIQKLRLAAQRTLGAGQ